MAKTEKDETSAVNANDNHPIANNMTVRSVDDQKKGDNIDPLADNTGVGNDAESANPPAQPGVSSEEVKANQEKSVDDAVHGVTKTSAEASAEQWKPFQTGADLPVDGDKNVAPGVTGQPYDPTALKGVDVDGNKLIREQEQREIPVPNADYKEKYDKMRASFEKLLSRNDLDIQYEKQVRREAGLDDED